MKNIFIDGCFDLFHFGHANALRRAKKLGLHLTCGINSFNEIKKNKGLPILSDEERYEVVKSCRWVDKVVGNVPYVPSMKLIEEFGCDAAVHGDDLVTDGDGTEVYKEIKAQGKFKEFKRTEGISTTEIVGRMMLLENRSTNDNQIDSYTNQQYNYLIEHFKLPHVKKQGTVVFMDGHFDLYHAGHCKAIENAKKDADYLIIGLHSDKEVKRYNRSLPILNEMERKLVLMSNRHVNEIIISPYVIDEDFIIKHGITKIIASYDIKDLSRFFHIKNYVVQDFYKNEFFYLNSDHIVNRIISNYQAYAARQLKKKNKI